MEAQEGNQQPQLVLAHRLFLLSHPDVQDIEKVRLREEVFASVKADGKFLEFDRLWRFFSHFDLDFFSNESPLSFCLCRYGSAVRNPSGRGDSGSGSGRVGLDAREDRGGAQKARREVSFLAFFCFRVLQFRIGLHREFGRKIHF